MIYFFVYLFLEVVISVNIASAIGGIATFIEIILSAVAGIAIFINFRSTLAENLQAVNRRQIDLQRFQELNIFTLLGAFLLIIPGFLTDIIGLLLQFGVFTSMLVNRFSAKFGSPKHPHHRSQGDDNVIDVEIISDTTTKR